MTRQLTVRQRTMVIISMVAIVLLLLASAVQANGGPRPTVDYQVQSGDSLWSIAEAHTERGDDVRAAVGAIQQLNELDGTVIFAGQVLRVPSG
jgi:LysM repeat protein